jgi:LysM repeat protein
MSTNVDKLMQVVKAEVGYCEKASNSNLDSKTANAGSGNYTKYARDLDKVSGFYNGRKNGHAWCDVFVDWCMWKTFGTENAKKLLCQPSNSLGAGCKYSMQYYQKKGQFYNSPKVGDQIFFKESSGDGIAHTGYVEGIDNTYVYTIEGNTSSASGVIANGGCVARKKYKLDYARIAGYGRPEYDSIDAASNATSSPNSSVTTQDSTKIGAIIQFTGNKHYRSSNSLVAFSCKPGKAKITATFDGLHKYHLVKVSGGGSTVNGWVDAKDINGTTSTISPNYQCIHKVVSGDSLWELSAKYLGQGKRYKEIMSLNNKKSISLKVGEKLKIPNK